MTDPSGGAVSREQQRSGFLLIGGAVAGWAGRAALCATHATGVMP